MKNEKQVIIIVSIAAVILIFFTKYTLWGLHLEDSTTLGLLGLLAGIIAVLKYFYEKDRDKNTETIELVSFFRNTVLVSHEQFANLLKEELGNKYEFVKVPITIPSTEYVRDNHSGVASKQHEYLFNKSEKIKIAATKVLNAVEEFSLKVQILNAVDSPYLIILHTTFIEVVEDLTVLLLFQRELLHNEDMYANTVSLCKRWEPHFDRSSPDERIRKFDEKMLPKN